MLIPGRHEASGSYRYGFQGQEKDDEIKGEGNSLNYTFRMHDPRVGRFFAIDPLTKKYPYLTPYQFSSNQPIHTFELEGLESMDEMNSWRDPAINAGNSDYEQAKKDIQSFYRGFNRGNMLGATIVSASFLAPVAYTPTSNFLWSNVVYLNNPSTQQVIYETTAFATGIFMGDSSQTDLFPNSGSDEIGKIVNRSLKPVAKLIDNIPRATWQDSESFVGKLLGKGYKAQQAFIKRELQSSRTATSAIPDFYNELTKHAVEIKNYDLTNRGGISNLINEVSGQINYRYYNLPQGTSQSVYIDITGQVVDNTLRKEISDRINKKLEKGVEVTIEFFSQKK
jgi:RHS repeat-associated protein